MRRPFHSVSGLLPLMMPAALAAAIAVIPACPGCPAEGEGEGEGEGEPPIGPETVTMSLTIREGGTIIASNVNCLPVEASDPNTFSNSVIEAGERRLSVGCLADDGVRAVYDFSFVRFNPRAGDNVVTVANPMQRPPVIMDMQVNGQGQLVNNRGRLIINAFDETAQTASGTIDITLETLNNRNINGSWSVVWRE